MTRFGLAIFALFLTGGALWAQDPAAGENSGRPRFLQASNGDHQRVVPLEAGSASILNRVVTLDLKDVRFGDLIREISEKSGVHLVFGSDLISPDRRVTLRAERITLANLLSELLHDTSVDVVVSGSQVALVRRPASAGVDGANAQRVGTVTGRITDSSSGAGLESVNIVIEGTRFNAVTNRSGFFRITNVPAGNYTLIVQRIGFATIRSPISVSDARETAVNLALDVSVLPLDELVATGTGFEARRRTLPNPITVITAAEIERKQAPDIQSLLRGEVPGLLPLSSGKGSRITEVYVRGNAGWHTTDYIKIYIDGVQVAHSTLISTIDPKNIERIEVVRGPQASVIYGSEAASGVLQIFTKKGTTDKPQLNLMASAGMIESEHTPSHVSVPMMQDYALDVSGGAELFSYRAGVSYGHVGEWVRNYKAETLGFSSGFRVTQGPLNAEFSALWSSWKPRNGADPIFMRYEPSAMCPQCGNPDYADKTLHNQSQTTTGLSLTYQATENWKHQLVLGNDLNRSNSYQREPNRLYDGDTLVDLIRSEVQRRSIRYNTAYSTQLGESVTGRFTLGGDYWQYDIIGTTAYDLRSAYGSVAASEFTFTQIQNNKWWNAGYFGMAELGVKDRLFLTFAARIEEMQNLGDDYGRPISPRAGAAYVQSFGAAEVKFRAQWGKGIRMPSASARAGSTTAWSVVLPNPDLGPEEKIGWDTGVEVYWSGRGSIGLTRYDEVGKNLIMSVDIDKTASPPVSQTQNIGKVGSKGWELEATLHLDRFDLRANYAYADNKILELSNFYTEAAYVSYRVGDRRAYIPKHSGGGSITARLWRGTATLNANLMKNWRAMDAIANLDYVYGDGPLLDDWYIDYPSLWKWNFRTEQTLSPRVRAFLRIDNLTNHSGTDMENYSLNQGRTSMLGVRISID